MLQNVVAMQHFAVIFSLSEQSAQATSKQMNQITTRLMAYGEFEVFTFGDECLLNQPVEEWPVCDYLLSWFSDGFPLDKAQAYIALRKVPTMNDLNMQVSQQNPNAMLALWCDGAAAFTTLPALFFPQLLLQDRRHMYSTLVEAGIPTSTHMVVDREGLEPGQDPEGFIEDVDFVELDGLKIKKPFVEKPFDGERGTLMEGGHHSFNRETQRGNT